ncbi:MAG: hypothetical protein IPJ30_14890 [Acidobacteria bacterium]|nr:hypothetical protein [Acidobacteriota bacterium]
MGNLIERIYLGDRYCKRILIDSERASVGIQVNVISFLRPGTVSWDFYADEDIVGAWLCFEDVVTIRFDPPGPLPNDAILSLQAVVGEKNTTFSILVGSVSENGKSSEIEIRIIAKSLSLKSPEQMASYFVDD